MEVNDLINLLKKIYFITDICLTRLLPVIYLLSVIPGHSDCWCPTVPSPIFHVLVFSNLLFLSLRYWNSFMFFFMSEVSAAFRSTLAPHTRRV